jgi:hypothetical protein
MADDAGVTFHISHRYGGDDANPPLGALSTLLDEVDEDRTDHEHLGVGVVHESGWAIRCTAAGS